MVFLEQNGKISKVNEIDLKTHNSLLIYYCNLDRLLLALISLITSSQNCLVLSCIDLQRIWHCWHCNDFHIVLSCIVLSASNTYMYGIIVCFKLLSCLSYCVWRKYQIIWGTQIFILVWKHSVKIRLFFLRSFLSYYNMVNENCHSFIKFPNLDECLDLMSILGRRHCQTRAVNVFLFLQKFYFFSIFIKCPHSIVRSRQGGF